MTITAKNYAAQAQAGLKLWADAAAHLYSKDAKAVRELSASIGDAVHFALPDNGRVMNAAVNIMAVGQTVSAHGGTVRRSRATASERKSPRSANRQAATSG